MSLFGFRKKAKKADDKYITVKEAAEMLGVYETTIRSWYDQGYLEGYVTPSGYRKILKSSAEELLKKKTK